MICMYDHVCMYFCIFVCVLIFSMVWYGMEWLLYGMEWHGMAWHVMQCNAMHVCMRMYK